MVEREPVSVLLPTVRWTDACDQMATQLEDGDELFVICDSDADPVADREPPDGVEILVAGEPEGCSGKANAIACGMERAANDRFVWTDADFDRADDWLETLVAAGDAHGPATAVPFYRGNGVWSILEPWAAVISTVPFYSGYGTVGGLAWGGGVTFTRAELEVSVPELVAELRSVLSDDVLLSQHLPSVHPVQSLVMPVEVAGDLGTTYARAVRLNRLTHVHEGMYGTLVGATLAAVGGAAFPLVAMPLVTLVVGAAYAYVGLRRATFLLAYPGLFVLPFVVLSGILVTEFEWAGRRYRLNDVYDVEVLDG